MSGAVVARKIVPVSSHGERMRRAVLILTFCVMSLAGCDYDLTGTDRCTGPSSPGELAVIIEPAYGFASWGDPTVFVGDTLPLVATVRPWIGSHTDVWGSGGCKPDFGEPLPATIEWSSSDVRIATVTQNGVVRGVRDGAATISARDATRGLVGGQEVGVWVRAGG